MKIKKNLVSLMNSRAILCLLILLLSSSIRVFGQKNLYLYLKDQTRVEIILSNASVMTYANHKIYVKSDNLDLEYNIFDIDRITFDATYTGIEKSLQDQESYIGIQDKNVCFRGFTPLSIVHVFTLTGKKYADYRIDQSGSLMIPIDDYQAGTYLFTVNNYSYKLIKK